MMLISKSYRALNRALHDDPTRGFGGSGYKWAGDIAKWAKEFEARHILDYGCGESTLKQALSDWLVLEYDPAVVGKEQSPTFADLVVATDVLEHVESQCLDAVLDHIQSLAIKAVFLTVATRPSNKTLGDGRNAHRIIQPWTWWKPKLSQRWQLLPQPSRRVGEFVVIGIGK